MVFPWPTLICAHAHIMNFLEKKKKKKSISLICAHISNVLVVAQSVATVSRFCPGGEIVGENKWRRDHEI